MPAKITLLQVLSLINSVIFLALGLYFFIQNNKQKFANFRVTNSFTWLFMSVAVASLMFVFFPESKAETDPKLMLGIKITGVIAAIIALWRLGILFSVKAKKDEEYETEITNLKNQIAEGKLETVKAQVITETKTHLYKLKNLPEKKIGIVTGNITNVKNIDIWVNSENSNMQMARFYDRSISGTIRYLGAKKDAVTGFVYDDLIANELTKLMGTNLFVQDCQVVVTGSGELQKTHGVKRIFHVAAVHGEISSGYKIVTRLDVCIINCLSKADSAEIATENLKTVLFPLFGAGTAREDNLLITQTLIKSAVSYLENHPASKIETVYFLAFTDKDLHQLKKVLDDAELFVRQ